MGLDHQAVRTDCHGGLCQCGHHKGDAGSVARVDHDRQMGHLFQHRHGGNIQRVAHARLKGADAALTQHDIGVALGHDVLSTHDQLLQGGGKAALEQHRYIQLADRLEQLKVLHVARADLDHIDLGVQKQRDMLVVHQLGHDGLAGDCAGLLQQLQTFGAQALKAVGAGAWLERAAAQDAGPSGLHPLRHKGDLLLALNAAGAAHDGKVAAADLVTADIDHGVIRVEFAVGLFVRLGHAAAGLDDRVGQHPAFGKGLGIADQAQNVGIAADGIIDLIPHAVELFAEGFDLVGGGVLFQYDNHGGILLSFLLLLSYTQVFLSMPIF